MKDGVLYMAFGLFLLVLMACTGHTMATEGVRTYYGNTTLTVYDPIDKTVTVKHLDGGTI